MSTDIISEHEFGIGKGEMRNVQTESNTARMRKEAVGEVEFVGKQHVLDRSEPQVQAEDLIETEPRVIFQVPDEISLASPLRQVIHVHEKVVVAIPPTVCVLKRGCIDSVFTSTPIETIHVLNVGCAPFEP